MTKLTASKHCQIILFSKIFAQNIENVELNTLKNIKTTEKQK